MLQLALRGSVVVALVTRMLDPARARHNFRSWFDFLTVGYVTNTPTFHNPARDISAANFGHITRTRGGPRVIQPGLKFRF